MIQFQPKEAGEYILGCKDGEIIINDGGPMSGQVGPVTLTEADVVHCTGTLEVKHADESSGAPTSLNL